ncbi:hypothetical protein VTK73DRAFT_1107 [Phialemonium thermophilum]|uniref:Uncharacterized protein n=1 Tax=Phialemonium thermophilum TaxID=223376 RepID=A0ABR3XBN5_9PEZI
MTYLYPESNIVRSCFDRDTHLLVRRSSIPTQPGNFAAIETDSFFDDPRRLWRLGSAPTPTAFESPEGCSLMMVRAAGCPHVCPCHVCEDCRFLPASISDMRTSVSSPIPLTMYMWDWVVSFLLHFSLQHFWDAFFVRLAFYVRFFFLLTYERGL